MTMNFEMLVSIPAASIIAAALALRLNSLRLQRRSLVGWQLLEAVGAPIALAGCVGVVGHWFVPNPDSVPADTIALVGLALFAVGAARGRLCQFVARLQGWDGNERRAPR